MFIQVFRQLKASPTIILIAAGYMEIDEKNYEQIANINYVSPMIFIEKSLINTLLLVVFFLSSLSSTILKLFFSTFNIPS